MDLSFEIPNNLTSEFCKEIIQRFENDARKHPGKTVGGFHPDMKNSMDLAISNFEEWNDVTDKLDEILARAVKEYDEFACEKLDYKNLNFPETLSGNTYQIQRSGYYRPHHDALVEKTLSKVRVLTYLWYLNTPETGGETDLVYKKIKPEEGKLLIFPASWEYIHAGLPAQNKYIITGWLYQDY